MKYFVSISLISFFFVGSTLLAEKPILQSYPITLQWINAKPGKIVFIAKGKDQYSIKGRQSQMNDLLEIEGIVTILDPKHFRFNGKIMTRVSYIAEGKECAREGTYTFRKVGKRKYFRLAEKDNPCDGVVDYIDIFK